jgi:hypothetical protein
MLPVGCRINPLSNLCFLPLKIENCLSEHLSIFAVESVYFKDIIPKLGYCDVFGIRNVGLNIRLTLQLSLPSILLNTTRLSINPSATKTCTESKVSFILVELVEALGEQSSSS